MQCIRLILNWKQINNLRFEREKFCHTILWLTIDQFIFNLEFYFDTHFENNLYLNI